MILVKITHFFPILPFMSFVALTYCMHFDLQFIIFAWFSLSIYFLFKKLTMELNFLKSRFWMQYEEWRIWVSLAVSQHGSSNRWGRWTVTEHVLYALLQSFFFKVCYLFYLLLKLFLLSKLTSNRSLKKESKISPSFLHSCNKLKIFIKDVLFWECSS